MPASITVNGQSLEALGFYVAEGPGLLDGPDIAAPGVDLVDRAGALLTVPRATRRRAARLEGSLDPSARTIDALHAANRVLKDLLGGGLLEIIVTDSSDNATVHVGVMTRYSAKPRLGKLHFQSATVLDVEVALSLEPTSADAQPTLRSLAVAGTRYDIPLGTAPSAYILNIMGVANNPVVTARAAGGALLWQLTFTKNLDTTNKWLSLDARTGRIWLYESGVKTDGIALLTGGQADWPKALDPHDGDYGTSQYMTLEVSPGTGEVLYWKRYG